MSEANTPSVDSVISNSVLEYIPEAHCYLRIDGKPLDVTSTASDFARIENDILLEVEIEPHQISEYKVGLHQKFIKDWLKKTEIGLTFEEAWALREHCIRNISHY